MKKATATFLTLVFLFNVIGYYGIYAGMIRQANKKAELAIETSTYDQSETVTIKIPLTLPYPFENGFERASGDFEYGGEYYKLVQQKYEKDTVYIVCLRNSDHKKAANIFSDLVKQSIDHSSVPNQNAKTLIGFLKDYNPTTAAMPVLGTPEVTTGPSAKPIDLKILNQDYPVPTPPPNLYC
ncbi:MAG: hypothetical protein JST69_01605 [Bacteroidetes bacterium]|nr:hypothetical protein [Bacteroidota bacterium]